MAKGRWTFSEEQIAVEAYAVLMNREKPGRTLTKADLKSALEVPDVYRDFLKMCLEHDTSKDLSHFRRGLSEVVKSVGVTKLSQKVGLSRLSLYRMLAKGGNPRLDSLLALFKALGVHLWLVDGDFKKARQKVVRPKDIEPVDEVPQYLHNRVAPLDDDDLDFE
jgi:probable addiction module antidote protein